MNDARGQGLGALDWDYFRLFAMVARAGSFTKAARELRLSEPTVSRRIKRLEAAIGAKLFDRGTGSPRLTYEGTRILKHAAAAEAMLSRAAELTESATRDVEGECKLMVGDGVGSYWLPQFLTPFFAANPKVDLVLFTSQDRAASKRPLFDLQILYMEPLDPDTAAVKLGTLHFTLFASRAYVAEHGLPESVEDLSSHRLLDLTLDLTEKGTFAAWGAVSGRPALFTNSNVVLGDTVRAGGGIALLPTYAALVDERLMPVMAKIHLKAPVFLCYSREVAKRPAVRATIDYLKDVVFAPSRMPWFAEDYVAPAKGWRDLLDEALAGAIESPRPSRARKKGA